MTDVPSTRDERIRRFVELDDRGQEVALTWFDLVRESDRLQRDTALEILRGGPLSDWSKAYLLELIPDVVRAKMMRMSYENVRWRHAQSEARFEAKDNFGKAWRNGPRRAAWRCAEEEELAFFEPLLRQNPARAPMIAAYVQMLRHRLAQQGIALPVEPEAVAATRVPLRPNREQRLVNELQIDETFLRHLEQMLEEDPTNEATAECVELARQDIGSRKQLLDAYRERRQQSGQDER